LQVKSPCAAPVACPFCKDVGYAVVFRGKKARTFRGSGPNSPHSSHLTLSSPLPGRLSQTPEEWQRELLEDQRVLEARLRNRSSSDGAEPMAPASAAGDQELPGGPSSPDPPPSSSSSSPLSALPTVQGSFRNSPAASPAADDDTRRAAFLAASPPSAAAGIAAMQQARLARLADFMSPAMLSRAMRGGGSMDLEDVMLMEGILASLQDAQPAALDAADGSASDSGSAESDCESPAAEGDVSSSAVAVPRAAGPPRRLARAASSVPQESAMGVARGALARRPSLDAAGIAPSLHAQLQFWGMHATPAAAAAAEAEMVAAAVRESLAAVPPVQPPAAEPPVAEPPAGELPADAEPAGAPAAAAEPPMVAEAAAEGAALSLQPSS